MVYDPSRPPSTADSPASTADSPASTADTPSSVQVTGVTNETRLQEILRIAGDGHLTSIEEHYAGISGVRKDDLKDITNAINGTNGENIEQYLKGIRNQLQSAGVSQDSAGTSPIEVADAGRVGRGMGGGMQMG